MRTPFPKQLLYVLIVLVPFGLLFFNSPFWHNVKTSAMSVGAVSVSIVAGPVGEVRRLLTYRRTWREYRILKAEVDRLRSQLSTSEEAAQENRRYSRLLNFKNTSVFSSVAARVVARDPSNWNASVMIDRGEKDGISPGMAVVNAAGVIGRVAEVGPHASKVILISDPGFRVAVVVQRSRESGLLSGSLSGSCRLDYLNAGADVKEGDVLVTAAISTAFPPGLRVATVRQVWSGTGKEGPRVAADPVVDVSTVEEVLVIK